MEKNLFLPPNPRDEPLFFRCFMPILATCCCPMTSLMLSAITFADGRWGSIAYYFVPIRDVPVLEYEKWNIY